MTYSIAKQVEANMIAAIEALDLGVDEIIGFRQPVAEPAVKEEDAAARSVVAVVVSLPAPYTPTTGIVEMAVAVSIAAERGALPQGGFDELEQPLHELFLSWDADPSVADAALGFAEFSLGGFLFDSTPQSVFDSALNRWTTSWTFTVRGTLLTTNEEA